MIFIYRKHQKNKMNSYTFPELYQFNSKNQLKKWQILVNQNIITRKWGIENGKIQTTSQTIEEGKNIGRSNATNPNQQALSMAESMFKKKLDEGYREKGKIESFSNQKNKNTIPEDFFSPMLALDYKDRGNDIKFPCFVQPKLDGVRAIFKNNELYSRNGKKFTGLFHIIIELQERLCIMKNSNIIIDGELYVKGNFENLVSIVKDEKPIDKRMIRYNIFDVYTKDSNDTFDKRYELIQKLLDNMKYCKIVLTEKCQQKIEVDYYLDKYIEMGHEGLILRNIKGVYRQKYRSPHLQKYKKFIDREYKIVGFGEGQGQEKGCVIWVCRNEDGNEFNVRPTGAREERKKLFINGKSYIGKMLNVKFQNYSMNNIPRFPVGQYIRDFE